MFYVERRRRRRQCITEQAESIARSRRMGKKADRCALVAVVGDSTYNAVLISTYDQKIIIVPPYNASWSSFL